MNVLKIAIRSIQHRSLGSLLTMFSMALGVMLVVGVLTMYGVVSQSFKSNTNFPYDIIVGASGSSMQVTMNTVYYLSSPVENIPYEYYLAFCDKETRARELKNSISYHAMQSRQTGEQFAMQLAGQTVPGCGWLQLATESSQAISRQLHLARMGVGGSGKLEYLIEMAVPVNLGDYLGRFRVVGTKPAFFEKIVLDIDTQKKLTFSAGRAFVEYSDEYGYFEAVLGANVARELQLSVGDVINPIHGDPNSSGAHTHEQGFTIVGILDRTGTPHDRAAFVNMEGFFLMEDHAKEVDESSIIGGESPPWPAQLHPVSWSPEPWQAAPEEPLPDARLFRVALPIEQREVTAILVRSFVPPDDEEDDDFASLGGSFVLSSAINEGFLESELDWSEFRPAQAKTEAQAVSPVMEVTTLFDNFVNPIRWVLLVLTIMICVVSGISILVGIYNSMSQRRHEIAVMRALGASRSKVMSIILLEAIALALAGGLIGWVAGHFLNVAASPFIEAQTGIALGFWDFAPPIPVLGFLGISLPGTDDLEWLQISPELLLIPGLIVLAILVGIYPAISAYRTDVAESLGT